MSESSYLIVGLGNPGESFVKTRHNVGYMVLQAFAEKHGFLFKRMFRVRGMVASGLFADTKFYLLKPTTYMNLSGQALNRCLAYYGIPIQNVLIVVDDVYLKLGTMRLRGNGGSAGHNGLKSIENALQTQNYSRLRIGIGSEEPLRDSLEDFVLDNFSEKESVVLSDVIKSAVDVVECWLADGESSAIKLAALLISG